ncbi:twin transmembrane helix small protein [Variovorax soli]|uniref:twin transmembrane helix small protein n=1 Tax=Variovorax soli TaxID=376815 RepID=UPI000838D66A|nr:twin transmembrane helix small protein [Variovorax soli]
MFVMKYVIALVFVGILASLGSALFFMLRGGPSGDKARTKSAGMARALTVRIGLSVVLFLCVLLAWKLGYIQPGGLPVGK